MLGFSIGAPVFASPYGGDPIYLDVPGSRTEIVATKRGFAWVSRASSSGDRLLLAAEFDIAAGAPMRVLTMPAPMPDALDHVATFNAGVAWTMESLARGDRFLFRADFSASAITSAPATFAEFAVGDGKLYFVDDGRLKYQDESGTIHDVAPLPVGAHDPLLVTSSKVIACGGEKLWRLDMKSHTLSSLPIPTGCAQLVEKDGTVYAALSFLVPLGTERQVYAYAVDESKWDIAQPIAALPNDYRPGELHPASIAVDASCVYVGFPNGGGIAKVHRSKRL